ncbi:MAG: hypothetical protein IJM79_01835 [Erysipelotrichaceae bacterium]|nr:hypothetical protein [Erysipelotrichaceae bacterium]
MTRIKRIILMTLLYAALFSSSFFMVSYFNGYHFMKQAALQLIIGVASLIAAVIIIALLFKRSNYSLMDMVRVQESEEQSEAELMEPEGTEEPSEEAEENQLSAGQLEVARDEFIHTTSIHTADGEVNTQTDIKTEEQPGPQAQVQQAEENAEAAEETETAAEAEKEPENEEGSAHQPQWKPLSSEISQPVLTVTPEVREDPLTATQISYINASANSYINEEGLPQLVMTKDLSKEDIERRKRQYERPGEIREAVSRMSDDEELDDDFYVQDEREDRLAAVLGRIIMVLSIILIFICGYYFYSRYLG